MTQALRYRTLWLGVGVALALTIFTLSVLPGQSLPRVQTPDKVNHFVAYCTLMVWWAQLFPNHRLRVAFACVAWGFLIEIVQPTLFSRYFEWYDNLANAVGVAIGWLLTLTQLGKTLVWFDRLLDRQL